MTRVLEIVRIAWSQVDAIRSCSAIGHATDNMMLSSSLAALRHDCKPQVLLVGA